MDFEQISKNYLLERRHNLKLSKSMKEQLKLNTKKKLKKQRITENQKFYLPNERRQKNG